MEMGRSQMLRVGIWGHRRHLSLYIVWSGLLFPAAVESRVYLMKRELMGLEPNEYRETLLHLHAPGQWGISWRGRWARENRLAAVCQGGSFIPRPIENRTIHQNKRPIHHCLQPPPTSPARSETSPNYFPPALPENKTNERELTRTPPSLSVGISIILGNVWVWAEKNVMGHACKGCMLKTLLSMHYNALYNTEVKKSNFNYFRGSTQLKVYKIKMGKKIRSHCRSWWLALSISGYEQATLQMYSPKELGKVAIGHRPSL